MTDTQRESPGRPLSVDRRTAIAGLAGVGALGAVAAACSSGSGNDAGSSGSGSSGPKSGTVLATLADIPVGEAVKGKDGDTAVLVAQPEKGKAVCFNAKCTHMGCPVQPAGKELHCPCHGSKYNASTGAVIHGPAPKPLAKIAVKVQDGKVVTA
ncbi:MAG TPA: Rieske (2Fe-2S) protein [Mycobacteriales bacterium]|nr:Rieske (2Fe-2S) protein [Mycobacteriales bacterium]